MAGKWKKTNQPCVYVQEFERTGADGRTYSGKRYKAAYRDARGKVTSHTFEKKADAMALVSKIRTDTREGSPLPDVSKARKTLADVWEHLDKTWRKKPSTLASYESRWTTHLAPVFGKRRIGSLRRSEIEVFLTELEERTSLETRRKVQAVLHKLLAVAIRAEWITANPADHIEMPGAEVKRQPRALTEAEVEAIAREVPPCYRALVFTLAETGMRVGEATALRVKNLDGTIRVVENAPEVKGVKITGTPKTEGSERNVPISPKLRAILREHLNSYANRFDPESLVFTTEAGTPVRQGNFRQRVFQPAAVRAGLKFVPTVHDLRHTAISLWLARGLTPFEVSKMAGHTDLKMIERRYGHLYVSALQEKIDTLGQGS